MALQPETAFRYRLINDAAVSAIISSRMFPHMPTQATTFPYMVFGRAATTQHHKMGSTSNAALRENDIQLAAYGTSEQYNTLKTLADEVRESLDGFRGTITVGGNSITFEMCHLTQETDGTLDPNDGAGTPLHFWEQTYGIAYQT